MMRARRQALAARRAHIEPVLFLNEGGTRHAGADRKQVDDDGGRRQGEVFEAGEEADGCRQAGNRSA